MFRNAQAKTVQAIPPLGIGSSQSRRRFLASLGIVGTAIVSGGVRAMDPLVRPTPGRLKLSLAAYSLRQYLTAQDGPERMDLFGFVDYCADQGLHGAELTAYYFPEEPSRAYLFDLKRHCHLRGVTITGGAIRNDFCTANAEKLAENIAHTRKWIDIYAFLGVPVIRIFAGNEQPGESIEVTTRRCAKACEEASQYAAEKGVLLALENHGGITATAAGLLNIVKQVDSKAFGINFDSGNFHSTDDPYAELSEIAPYSINAQLKVEIYQGGKKVETDLRRVLEILASSGYSGWVALEYEASEDPLTAIPVWLERLKTLMIDFA
jgi:sugar phosphate isomerase/epimerase